VAEKLKEKIFKQKDGIRIFILVFHHWDEFRAGG